MSTSEGFFVVVKGLAAQVRWFKHMRRTGEQSPDIG
jgi:hypothetical protein